MRGRDARTLLIVLRGGETNPALVHILLHAVAMSLRFNRWGWAATREAYPVDGLHPAAQRHITGIAFAFAAILLILETYSSA